MKTNTVQITTLPNLDVQIGDELYKFSRWGVSCLGMRGAFVIANDGSEHWVSEAYYPRLTKHALDGGYAPANQDAQAKAATVKRADSPRRK